MLGLGQKSMQIRRAIGVFILSASAYGQNIITSMAGTGFPGFSGDDGPAASAQLYTPQNAAVDSNGTVYFSDNNNHRIRRVTPDGTISSIAGNGIQFVTGVSSTDGDGGPALSASLGWVYQVAISPDNGTLCFGDYGAYKIRCVTLSTGIIQGYGTGQAAYSGDGGPVSEASFYFPRGVAYDPAGNLYVADFAANTVRQINWSTGIVTRIAGGGTSLGDGEPATAASLSFPNGLAYSSGALYIADQGNNRVRRVDLTSGIITTVAGNGSPYFSGDGGPATSAGVSPIWIALDQSGDLFIAGPNVVRMVNAAGTISTIAGNGNSGWGYDDVSATQTVFSGLDGLAWDQTRQRLLISDYADRIRQIFFTPPTTIFLSVTPNSANPGQAVTLQATLLPESATGSVRFHNGYNVIATAPVNQGLATFTWTPPGTGSFAVYAIYGGDLNDNLSSSSTITVSVKNTSAVTLTSSANPVLAGSPVTLTAVVGPSGATGVVQFFNGGSLLGSATLTGGQAQLTVSMLPAGTDSLIASYGGDTNYNGSTSPVLVETVKGNTSITLNASPNPSTYGTAVTLSASVTPSSATGFVQFANGNTVLGSVALSGGTAKLSVTALPAGTDTLTASYLGDSLNAPGSPAVFAETVNKANSSVGLSATPTSQSNSGQTVTLTARVTPSIATGTVQFLDGSVVIGTASLANGNAVFATSSLSSGNHSIKANYTGDGNVNGSESSALPYKVKH